MKAFIAILFLILIAFIVITLPSAPSSTKKESIKEQIIGGAIATKINEFVNNKLTNDVNSTPLTNKRSVHFCADVHQREYDIETGDIVGERMLHNL